MTFLDCLFCAIQMRVLMDWLTLNASPQCTMLYRRTDNCCLNKLNDDDDYDYGVKADHNYILHAAVRSAKKSYPIRMTHRPNYDHRYPQITESVRI